MAGLDRPLQSNFGEINHLEHAQPLQEIVNKHAAVFDGELGCLKDVEVKLQISDYDNLKPKLLITRTVPYVLKQKVEAQLDRLSSLGIISPVKFSNWTAPIVKVLKNNGDMRIIVDFKTIVYAG